MEKVIIYQKIEPSKMVENKKLPDCVFTFVGYGNLEKTPADVFSAGVISNNCGYFR